MWELTGEPATWEAQLRKYLASQPVFAVISGLGGSNWGPVHRFCEAQALPCLFPNVEAPVGNDSDFYSVYFSRGVLLEAQLIARELAEAREPIERRPYRISLHLAGLAAKAGAPAPAATGDLLLDPIQRTLRERVTVMPIEQVEVLQSQLGNNAGVIGVACWAAKQL